MRFSVVIPYGNAEQTIGACLDSVIAAADRYGAACEVICVNGGSADRSVALVDERARRDGRIRHLSACPTVVGPGRARNAGLDVAAGGYVVFVDADDTLKADALVRLAECDADIITFLPPEGTWDMSRPADRRRLFSPLVGNLLVWNACFRREMIGGWRFPDLRNHEDIVWTTGMFVRAKTVVSGVKPWYVHNEKVVGSLANTYSWRRVRDGLAATGLMFRAARGAHAGLVTRLVLARKLTMHLLLHVVKEGWRF